MDGRAFALEKITDVWPELEPLATLHLTEVSAATRWLRLDRDAYAAMEAADRHAFHTMRINGELSGYCSTLICQSPHDGLLEAHEDGIYVRPDLRGWSGSDLEHFVDTMMACRGCSRSFRERIIGTDHDAKDRAMRRGPLGYKPQSVLWCKELAAVGVENG